MFHGESTALARISPRQLALAGREIGRSFIKHAMELRQRYDHMQGAWNLWSNGIGVIIVIACTISSVPLA